MNQLVALLVFLVLTVHGPPDALGTPTQRIAYMLGGITARVAIFMVLHALVYFGAKLARPKDVYVSFWATRLNYLTLGILVFVEASAHIKH